MDRNELIKQILLKTSFLCVGLDPDTQKIPKHFIVVVFIKDIKSNRGYLY